MIKQTTIEQLAPFIRPQTKQVLIAATGIFTLGLLALFGLIGVLFFAVIVLLSWCLNMALTFVSALGEHLTHIWSTGDDFTKALVILVIGYIVFRLVVPHIRSLIRK